MLDIRFIIDNLDRVKDGGRRKRIEVDIDRLVTLYEERKRVQQQIEAIAAEKNKAGKTLPKLPPAEKQAVLARMKELTDKETAYRAEVGALDPKLEALQMLVPMPPAPEVPDGKDDTENVELRRVGEIPKFDFAPKGHMELAAALDIADKDRATKMAGSRTYFLKGDGALLELAVLKFAMDHMVGKGFTAMLPPVMVNDDAMRGTGYFPGGEEQAYRITADGLNLVGTAEVPLTSYHSGEILDDADMPSTTPAGATASAARPVPPARTPPACTASTSSRRSSRSSPAGPTRPRASREHHHILGNSEAILQALKLPYRVVNVCTGDLGRGRCRNSTWRPGCPAGCAYGETHSASRFHDFQARRLNLRYRDKDGKVRICHTLNNTVVASPRILIPILELYQNADGTVTIPEVLRPYMGGRDRIVPRKRK